MKNLKSNQKKIIENRKILQFSVPLRSLLRQENFIALFTLIHPNLILIKLFTSFSVEIILKKTESIFANVFC